MTKLRQEWKWANQKGLISKLDDKRWKEKHRPIRNNRKKTVKLQILNKNNSNKWECIPQLKYKPFQSGLKHILETDVAQSCRSCKDIKKEFAKH